VRELKEFSVDIFQEEQIKMFIKSPLGRTYFNQEVERVSEVINFVCEKENLLELQLSWKVEQCGKFLDSEGILEPNGGTVTVIPAGGLVGGKGGFGSLLRAIGAQIQKTTNHEAMRDLSGRRQRDVNNEQRAREYVAKQAEREQVEREKKEAKLAKLERLAKRENKHEFSDPAYDKVRSETEEKIHDAMEAAMNVAKEQKKTETDKETDLKRKAEAEKEEPPKKKKMWMGDGLEGLSDEDLSDSDEEADESKTVAVA